MKILNVVQLLHLSLVLVFSLQIERAIAAGDSDPAPVCVSAEGIPVPKCVVPQFHYCHFPPYALCRYIRVEKRFKVIGNPKHGTCAQNQQTCTTDRDCSVPERCVDRVTCTCNQPIPNVTECKKSCGFCRADGPVVDSGVKCPTPGCNPVPTCQSPLTINGDTYWAVNPDGTPSCNQAPDTCVGEVTGNPPPTVDQCPNPPIMQWGESCCYSGSGPRPAFVPAGMPQCT